MYLRISLAEVTKNRKANLWFLSIAQKMNSYYNKKRETRAQIFAQTLEKPEGGKTKMRKRWWKSGKGLLAAALSAAMVISAGTPAMSVYANDSLVQAAAQTADGVIFSDDMEGGEDGWNVAWSGEAGTLEKKVDAWAANNKTQWWHFWSKDAQTLTLTREITGVSAGSYAAAVETDGENASGVIIISDGKTKKSADLVCAGWDIFTTGTTKAITVEEGATLTVTIKMDIGANGWGDLDNCVVMTAEPSEEGGNENQPEGNALSYTDDMEADADDGWTINWSDSAATTLERKTQQKDPADANNTSNVWNFWSEKAQTLTLSRTFENVKAGTYAASVEADGEKMGKSTISISDGTTTKSADLTFAGWAMYKKATTDALPVAEGANVTVTIKLVFEEGGWGDLDNVVVDKALTEAEQKAAKAEALEALVAQCDKLAAAAYTEDSYKAMKDKIAAAKEVLKNLDNATLEDLIKVFDELKAANEALVKADPVDTDIWVQRVDNLSKDFIHGIDVSTYLSEVRSGVKYYDANGVEKNMFEIMRDAGVNYIRLRVWNCPYSVDANGNIKYADEDGNEYSADKVVKSAKHPDGYTQYYLADGTEVYRQGYGAGTIDAETAGVIGGIAAKYGLKTLVDFHYSDFWADPKKQSQPKAWKGLTLDEKAAALKEYTSESLKTIKAGGADIGMVQVGNETNNGMAGETDSASVCKLMRAGSEAVREFDPNVMIAIHYTDPQSEGYQLHKAGELAQYGVDYDVFATSYYPFWHGTPAQLTKNLQEIANKYDKKVMVAEVSYAWTAEDGDGYGPNIFRADNNELTLDYPIGPEGQATAVRDAIAAVAAVGDAGIGTFYWEGGWIPVQAYDAEAADAADVLASNQRAWKLYGSGWGSIYAKDVDPEINDIYNGNNWENQALFDFNGKMLPSLNVYNLVYTGAKGPVNVSTVDTLNAEIMYGEAINLPKEVAVRLNDGSELQAPVVWDAKEIEALKTAEFGEYVINGVLGEFSFDTEDGKVTVEAGKWTTTCQVKVTGKNLLFNGSFEENGGSAEGWTLINHAGDGVGNPTVGRSTSNAKTGEYYYTAWNKGDLDFSIEQTVTEFEEGAYTAFAWYQGTAVKEMLDTSKLYAVVKYKDGTEKTYDAEVKILNEWKAFYQAIISGIRLDDTVESITVGTRLSCTAQDTGAWVVIDDISLMRKGDLSLLDKPENNKPGQDDKPGTDDNKGETTDKDSKPSKTPDKTAPKKDVPATGDSSDWMIWAAAVVLAAGCIVAVKRRRNA